MAGASRASGVLKTQCRLIRHVYQIITNAFNIIDRRIMVYLYPNNLNHTIFPAYGIRFFRDIR